MRIFTFIVCCIVTSASVAAEPQYVAADSSMETALCISAATSDRLDFKQDLQHNRMRPVVAANKLQCNDLPVASFALQAGNTAVYQHLKKYVKGHVDIQDIAAVPGQSTVVVRGR
ncbi:DUF3718 domain-containing protein [Rheinheimera sp.]|uniref:DUF3718 domain-containing protein n=1 Tax=Rheinheimera sp. TaxID=1869214 RepID=UPI003D2E1BB6